MRNLKKYKTLKFKENIIKIFETFKFDKYLYSIGNNGGIY